MPDFQLATAFDLSATGLIVGAETGQVAHEAECRANWRRLQSAAVSIGRETETSAAASEEETVLGNVEKTAEGSVLGS